MSSIRLQYEAALPPEKREEVQNARRERIVKVMNECRKVERSLFKVRLTMRSLLILGILAALILLLIHLNK